MNEFKPEVTEHATRDEPILEDFLYLFFSQSETSQAAGRAFWERRHTRQDQDVLFSSGHGRSGERTWRLGHGPSKR